MTVRAERKVAGTWREGAIPEGGAAEGVVAEAAASVVLVVELVAAVALVALVAPWRAEVAEPAAAAATADVLKNKQTGPSDPPVGAKPVVAKTPAGARGLGGAKLEPERVRTCGRETSAYAPMPGTACGGMVARGRASEGDGGGGVG